MILLMVSSLRQISGRYVAGMVVWFFVFGLVPSAHGQGMDELLGRLKSSHAQDR